MQKKIWIFIWSFYILVVCLSALGVVAIKKGWIGYMPPLEDLQNPISKLASQVISSDGKLLGTWSKSENRILVDYDSIAPSMIDALVATEDVRFFEHSGIDARALARAVVKRGLLGRKEAGGGSTITQQLAKQLYSSTASSTLERLFQKPIEWVIAVELERNYTKEEIIALYLNYFDFLHNAVGVKTAAQVYFGKLPSQLTLAESATLVGMCKNPSYYNPVRYPERCLERRNVVFRQMEKAGYISEAEFEQQSKQPLTLNFRRIDHKEGTAPYLREYLRRALMAKEPKREDYHSWQKQQYYEDSVAWNTNPLYGWCNKNFKRDGSAYNIYVDGLKVYTTVDSRMQRYAEESMRTYLATYLQPLFEREGRNSSTFPYSRNLSKAQVDKIIWRSVKQSDRYRLMKEKGASDEEINAAFGKKTEMAVFTYHGIVDTTMTPLDSVVYYKKFLRSGLLSIDPLTGYVKAYVGGVNFSHFQYDMCMSGRRQIGSTMKPFIYALAMEDGKTPCDLIPNVQKTYNVGVNLWTPRNGSKARYGEDVTLKWGLSQSNNWVTAGLMSIVDPSGNRLKDFLGDFGVVNPDIHPSMALCLGTCDITVGELASAYTAFVNKGIRCAPILVTRIEDSEGNVLADFHPRMNEVLGEESSYKMIEMLRAVIDQGTGRRLRFRYNMSGEIAGKTGTTNRNSDGWFVGFVPRLVTACWVGGEDRDIHFTSTASGQGATVALPIWATYMKKVYANKKLGYSESEKFNIPANFDSCEGYFDEESEDSELEAERELEALFE